MLRWLWLVRAPLKQTHVPCSGNLGLFYLTPESHALLLADPAVSAKVAEWKQVALASSTGLIDDNLTRGLSVRQPAAEAIACGKKTIENRSRSIFPIHGLHSAQAFYDPQPRPYVKPIEMGGASVCVIMHLRVGDVCL
jgi:hypothetical protein